MTNAHEAPAAYWAAAEARDWDAFGALLADEGQHAASWIELTGPAGTQPGLCFFDFGDHGQITQIADFWPERYELPAGRAQLAERY